MRGRRVRFSIIGLLVVTLFVTLLAVHRKLRWPLVGIMAAAPPAAVAQGPTVINISPVILHENVIRLGMNLGSQTNFDSQQILKNLISENPGFEGRQWQTVLRCNDVTPTSCTDSGGWPEGFLDGGTYEVLTGAAAGETGTILHTTGRDTISVQFAERTKPLGRGDYIAVRKVLKGDGAAGWNKYTANGATISTEYDDLSPRTPGSQALRINASGNGLASLSTLFDAIGSRSYVQMHGPYRIRFRAKVLSGNNSVNVSVRRIGSAGSFCDRTVPLSNTWQDYTLDFDAQESPRAVGAVMFVFGVDKTDLLLDDVSLEEATSNGTAFRDAVVATLQRLNPGVLRYMDSSLNFGSSLDNMIAPAEARQRSGFNAYSTSTGGPPIGLHDFLVLCEKLGTEPWYTMQIGMSTQEAANIMEYLGGPVTTKYGAARAALGHPLPWTQTFPRIHLEYGNEAWNTAFAGAAIADSDAYASRTNVIFQTIRSSKWYSPDHFNLIADSQAVYPGRTVELLKTMRAADMIDIAPYLFNTFADDSSIEHIFGPMLAQPQVLDDTVSGYVQQQAHVTAVAEHPVHLAVYEVNTSTTSGTVKQASIDATVPSLGAGLAVIDHELLMLRDLGITLQNTYQLGHGDFPFNNTTGIKNETTPTWSAVVDMGGATNRVKPVFLAQQLANEAIRSKMLTTSISGDNPTWNQPHSANDDVDGEHIRELQTFAFADTAGTTLIVLNLSRTSARTVGLAGACAPQGKVKVQMLTSGKITDNNELQENVKTVTREEQNVVPGTSVFTLPPFSMTSFSSINRGCVPDK